MKTRIRPFIIFVLVCTSLLVAIPNVRASKNPLCGIINTYTPNPGETYDMRQFPATTADWRTNAIGTYYIAYHRLPYFLNAADLGWDGILGTSDDGAPNIRLASTRSLSYPVSPVASGRRILYDFDYVYPYGSPLILYDIGNDGLLRTADDRIIPIAVHHVLGSDTKDVAREAMIYMLVRNGPPVIVYHHLGPDGIPSADDYAAPLTHYSFSILPVEVKVSYTGKFALRFISGQAELYDLTDMRYAAGGGDDVVYNTPQNAFVHAIDISPDGRYTAYTYTYPPSQNYFLDVYDVGPNSRLENLQGDDALYTITNPGNLTQPRIDGQDTNNPATARLVYVNETINQINYVNAGSDARFGTADDQNSIIYQYQGSSQINSLRIVGSLVTFNDYDSIYTDFLCS